MVEAFEDPAERGTLKERPCLRVYCLCRSMLNT